MEITRVILDATDYQDKSLAVCSVVLEDCLKLTNIRLFKNDKGFYLVLPSKQDMYQEVKELNAGVELKVPENKKPDKKYEEFYYPLSSDFYERLLGIISSCFKEYKETGSHSFRFDI